jgi:hypothetical protein
MSDLKELAERIERGETGLEIDAAAYGLLFDAEIREQEYAYFDGALETREFLKTQLWKDGKYVAGEAPRYSTSLDAVAALAERVLPGWGFYLRKDTDGCGCGMVYPEANRVTPCHVTTPTPAAALLAAILRAKAAP